MYLKLNNVSFPPSVSRSMRAGPVRLRRLLLTVAVETATVVASVPGLAAISSSVAALALVFGPEIE